MKTLANALAVLVVLFALDLNAQKILFPPSGVTLYTGDKIPICWKTSGYGNDVWIHLYSPDWRSGKTMFVAAAYPDSGEFEWTVSKGLLTETNLILTVFYSGISGAPPVGEIPVVVLPGPRPADSTVPSIQPIGVPVNIRKVVSIEWIANTNHNYQVMSSSDMENWIVEAEGFVSDTNAMALFYQEQDKQFFRVVDTTPLRP